MKAQIISFNCLLKNKLGHIISRSTNRNVLTMSEDPPALLYGLAPHLQNLTKGQTKTFTLSALEAYGYYDPKNIILYPRKKLPTPLKVNEYLTIAGKSGKLRTCKVVQLHDDLVTLDGNHPLAGQDLVFEIETLDVREATTSEIADSASFISQQKLH